MNSSVTIRPAQPGDVDAIFELLELYTASGIVLKRSKEDISGYLANFIVAVVDGSVCGCCAARDFGHDLLEVRSLVVSPVCQGKGVGKKQVDFFKSLGFSVVEKEIFPEKIWSDCSKCPKFNCCDETALLLEKK